MKLTGRGIEDFLAAPGPLIRVVLVFGADAGLVSERAARLARTVVPDATDPFRICDLQPAQVEKEPALLADEAAAVPMMGGRRLVRLRGVGDAVTPAVVGWLSQLPPTADSLVVIEAGELDTRSKLRLAVEGAEQGATIVCYPTDAGDLQPQLAARLRGQEVSIAPDALELMASWLVGDRQLAMAEADKLALWAGAKGHIDAETVRALLVDSADMAIEDAVRAAASGDHAATDRALGQLLADGESTVSLLRAGQRYFQKLELAKARQMAGEDILSLGRSLWGPVFFRLRADVERQLARWSPPALRQIQAQLLETEAAVKRTGTPVELLTRRLFMRIAALANRQARR